MKLNYLVLLAIIFLVGCKKSDMPAEKDDTFFDGSIGVVLYDSISNEFRTQKLIRTIHESPFYCSFLSDTFNDAPNSLGLVSIELQFNISEPIEGKVYEISKGIDVGNTIGQGIVCRYTNRTSVDPKKMEDIIYVPIDNKPVQIFVKKVERGNITKSTIVEGAIKGYLFNAVDMTDSIPINATFRTKRYLD